MSVLLLRHQRSHTIRENYIQLDLDSKLTFHVQLPLRTIPLFDAQN